MPQAIAAGLTAAGIASGMTATVLGYAVYTAGSLLLMKALAPQGQGRGTYVNGRAAAGPHAVIYGQVRVSGEMTYMEATGDTNDFHHYMIPVAGHQVEEIGDVYLDDEIVTLDGSGFVTTAKWLDKNGNPVIRIKKHLGGANQAADSDFLAETEDPAVDANFRGRGIAYVYVRIEYDEDVFAQGIPVFSFVVKGREVYDPRTGTWGWSDNAALCILDYITQDWGLAENIADLDMTPWQIEANICDEVVTTPSGPRSRYTANGMFHREPSQDPSVVMPQMLSACAGTLFYSGGYYLKTGYYATPTLDLDENDFRGPIRLAPRKSIQENFNRVQATYLNADADWIEADLPPIESAVFLAEDGGNKSTRDIHLPFTTNADDGARLASILLNRTREGVTFTARFSMAALKVAIGQTVRVSFARYGWTLKSFEVIDYGFAASVDEGLVVELTLQETSAELYDPTIDHSVLTANNASFRPYAKPPVSAGDFTISAQSYYNDGGWGTADVTVSVSVARRGIRGYECRYRVDPAAPWAYLGRSDAGEWVIDDIANRRASWDETHVEYLEIAARTINRIGQPGDWSDPVLYQPTPRDRTGRDITLTDLTNEVGDALVAYERADLMILDAIERSGLQSVENVLQDYLSHEENKASIIQEQETRLTADEAFAQQLLVMQASLDGTAAALLVEQTARADGDTALASQITSMAATVDGHTVSIGVNATAIATTNAAVGDYVIRLNTGGAEALFELWAISDLESGSAQSGVKISSDYFYVDSDLSLFGGVVASDNYAEDGSGNPTAGWKLDGPNGVFKVPTLSAISATLGSFATAATGERVEISDDVIKVYDNAGTLRVKIGDLTA